MKLYIYQRFTKDDKLLEKISAKREVVEKFAQKDIIEIAGFYLDSWSTINEQIESIQNKLKLNGNEYLLWRYDMINI